MVSQKELHSMEPDVLVLALENAITSASTLRARLHQPGSSRIADDRLARLDSEANKLIEEADALAAVYRQEICRREHEAQRNSGQVREPVSRVLEHAVAVA